MTTLQLLIRGVRPEAVLPVFAGGQLELPKEPPFKVLTPGPAALVTVEIEPESPDCLRLFDAWYRSERRLDVAVYDGQRTRIRGAMACVGMEHMDGIQITRPWSEPLRRAHADGQCRLYRATPRFQEIARPIHRYQLAADRYRFIGKEDFQHGDRRDQVRAA